MASITLQPRERVSEKQLRVFRTDSAVSSITSFAYGPTRRDLRQIKAASVRLDASACAEKRSESAILDRSRTNQPFGTVRFCLSSIARPCRDAERSPVVSLGPPRYEEKRLKLQ